MDTVKKAKFEQRMVLILLVVFVACFVQLLRRLGFIGRKPAPTASTPAGVQAVEQYRERMDEVQTLGLGTVIRPVEASGPGAGEAEPPPRDPLMSLLPGDLPSPAPAGLTGKGAAGTAQADVRPPPLTVHGVIVGGRHPQALIDEGVYGVGDLVKGARIVAIERDGVLVMAPGGLYRLSPDAGAELVKRATEP